MFVEQRFGEEFFVTDLTAEGLGVEFGNVKREEFPHFEDFACYVNHEN